ncbi:MAG: DUF3426 domain-containing protein [Lautropia sp.]|nr:DUF3426 domain-containing protein [Lautropia sp.]
MALATTCPQCKTSFKVVPDQLKLRRGLVRCGVCQHVFSGVEHLRYVDKDESTEKIPAPGTDSPPSLPLADTQPAPDTSTQTAIDPRAKSPGAAASPPAIDAHPAPVAAPAAAPRPTTSPAAPQPVPQTAQPRAARDTEQPVATPAPSHDDDEGLKTMFFMADGEGGTQDDVQLPESLRHGSVTSLPEDDDTVATSKLISEANKIWRQQKPHTEAGTDGHGAEHESRRHRRSSGSSEARGRASAIAWFKRWLAPGRHRWISIVLAIVALIQILAIFRNEIVAHVPVLRPVIAAAATLTGKTIEPPMSLASLSIESFELRATRQANQTRMTAILRNRGTVATRWPAMELTLTGPSNALLVRKVLLPGQYLPSMVDQTTGIPANSEQPLDLLLETDDVNLAGYSVSLFYP